MITKGCLTMREAESRWTGKLEAEIREMGLEWQAAWRGHMKLPTSHWARFQQRVQFP
jgi:hypothetical protein